MGPLLAPVVEVDATLLAGCWLHGFPFLLLLQCQTVLVLAFGLRLNGPTGCLAEGLGVNTFVAWLVVLAATLTCYLKAGYLGFSQVHFRRLFYHVVEGHQEKLRESRTKVGSV